MIAFADHVGSFTAEVYVLMVKEETLCFEVFIMDVCQNVIEHSAVER